MMGGYGVSSTISGVFPVEEYYRDAVMMELKNGGQQRQLGDVWEEGERKKLGKIIFIEDEAWVIPAIFMLDVNDIMFYNFLSHFGPDVLLISFMGSFN